MVAMHFVFTRMLVESYRRLFVLCLLLLSSFVSVVFVAHFKLCKLSFV